MTTLKEQVPEMGTIEVFQALHIEAPPNELSAVRQKLIDTAQAPWAHDNECQNGEPDITVFRHSGDDAHSSVRLRLRQNSNCFDVSSINPIDVNGLDVKRYNVLLQDFAESVVAPVVKYNGAAMTLSSQRQGPVDWLNPEAVRALNKFSRNADKRLDYFLPEDKDRWMEFLIKAHDGDLTDSVCDNLERWLRHSEGLSDEMSDRLSSGLRFGTELLKYYDKAISERSAS